MSITTIDRGFDGIVKAVTGGTCTTTNDQISLSGGTCTSIGALNNYSLNMAFGLSPVTSFGDKIEKNIPMMPSGTFSASGYFDYGDTAQKAVWDEIVQSGATAKSEKVYRIHGTKAVHTIKGYLTGGQVSNSTAGAATFNMDISLTLIPKTCSK